MCLIKTQDSIPTNIHVQYYTTNSKYGYENGEHQ